MVLDKEKCITVILAGDAPNENGEIKFYTADEAKKIAEHIKEKAKKMKCDVLVTNGPRTGKHNHETGKENDNNHRRDDLDEVTNAFMKEIEDPNIECKLFNFDFRKTSLYKSLIGLTIKQGDKGPSLCTW